VGAGILGLPINTGIDGFIPSLLAMLLFGGAMFFTATVLGREAVQKKEDDFNFPSLYQYYLGNIGKWIAILANMLILYGLLTAYLTGGTTIVAKLFHIEKYSVVVLCVIFLILTGLTVMGSNVIRKYNALLMILLWGSFAVIVFMGEEHVKPVRLLQHDWGFLPVAIPIIVTSFHFHNIIPNVCHSLEWKMSTIWKAMLAGMIIGYVMNAVWIEVGVGALPLEGSSDSIIYAFKHNIPATVPMADIIGSKLFSSFAMLFALLAIATSYIANGLGLTGFNRDLAVNFFKQSNKFFVMALTFIPPFIISLLFPNIFLKAINLVGGVGIVILFGILPCIIAFIKASSVKMKALAVVFLVLFASVFLFQMTEEFGFVKLTPKAEDVDRAVHKSMKADKTKKNINKEVTK
jgi:tyrosine-specific transport protein